MISYRQRNINIPVVEAQPYNWRERDGEKDEDVSDKAKFANMCKADAK